MMKGVKPPVPAPRHIQTNGEVVNPPRLPARRPTTQPTVCPSQTNRDDIVQALKRFALSKQFTEEECSEAIKRTNNPEDTNDFFAQLVSVRAEMGFKEYVGHNGYRRRPVNAAASKDLRKIVIDGSNVAMTHGNGQFFSSRGIQIVVEWFQERGHNSVQVFVPSHRKEATNGNRDVDILHSLEAEGNLQFTPSWETKNGSRITCYDDRFILDYARDEEAIVVSNDHFKDLIGENPGYREVAEQRRLGYAFANDRFMPPEDPTGRRGPTLNQFLRVKSEEGNCKYGRKCTYGTKCKYSHPERHVSAIQPTQQKRQQRDDELHKNKHEKRNENMVILRTQPRSTQQDVHGVEPFWSHPTNVRTMPVLIARGPSDEAEQGATPINATQQRTHIPGVNQNQFNQSEMRPPSRPRTQIQLPVQRRQPTDISNKMAQRPTTTVVNGERDFTDPSHARHNLYFHLKALFPEQYVRMAMHQMPNETDSSKLCQMIMDLRKMYKQSD